MDKNKVSVNVDGDMQEGRFALVMVLDEGSLTTTMRGDASMLDVLALYGRFKNLVDQRLKGLGLDSVDSEMLIAAAEDAADEVFGDVESDEDKLIDLIKNLLS